MKKLNASVSYISIFILLLSGGIWGCENNYKEILFKMKERLEKVETYQCTFEAYSAKGEKTRKVIFKYFFKKPKMVRMDIQEGKYKGTVLLYIPHKVRVKLGKGFLSLFSFSFKPENKKVTDLRGHGMHQSDWGWYIDQHIQMLELTVSKFSGEEFIEGKNVLVYKLFSKDLEKTGSVAKETLWIDSKEFIPVKYVQEDTEGKIILSAFYRDIIMNIDLKNKLFEKFRTKQIKNEKISYDLQKKYRKSLLFLRFLLFLEKPVTKNP